MKRLLSVLFPMVAAGFLVIAGSQARADTCFGGGGRKEIEPADAGTSKDGGVASNLGKFPRRLGAGFLCAACVSSGWLCFRRKDPEDKV